jgi:hypothetical protein
MPYRIAVIVAGAVSLGSYEAGVVYEIIDAIGQHNSAAPAKEQIFIDVLTGASAGGMSATVLAQKLLFEAGSLANPYDNILYRAWVEDIQLQSLLALQPGEDSSHSVLSSNLVETLSAKYLCHRYSTHFLAPPDKHAAAAGTIRLGLALSNLNGVDYSCQVRPSSNFTYTRFEDQISTKIDATSDALAFWEPLRNAAVSCGAFPFAFRVKELVRHRSEFTSPNIVFPLPFETFTYTDGGVLQNEPLGLAKNLVDEIDEHTDTESRFYLFVAPHVKGSTAHSDFNESKADYKTTGLQLFNLRAGQLQDLLVRCQIQTAPLRDAADALLPLFFAARGMGEESLSQARQRLAKQFSQEYAAIKASPNPGAADIWIDSILVLETAADLGQRDEMFIYGITASENELAGTQLEAFVGFFEQEYRDHDYDVGRTKAQQFLQNADGLLGTPGNLPLIQYVPKPIHPINHDLDGLTLKGIPRDIRETVKSRLEDRANDLLEELKVSWPVREAIKLALVDPYLEKLLGL